MLIRITKSAQLPFRAWLPLAMAAPTPISALVHSSTLVTAGVFLVISLNLFVYKLVEFLFVLSILTIIHSGILASFELDLKKVVAYSTLSQVALVLYIYSLGLYFISYAHLLLHAIFKSLLFLSVGVYIHIFFRRQSGNSYFSLLPLIRGSISILSINAINFLRGFYSKDLFIEVHINSFIRGAVKFLFIVTIFITFYYSLSVVKTFLSSYTWMVFSVRCFTWMIIPLVLLSVFSILFGGLWVRGLLYSVVYVFKIVVFFMVVLVCGL